MTADADGRESVAFVTVQYRNSGLTREFVESVARADGFDRCRIVIVDNAATQETTRDLAVVKRHYGPRVTTIALEDNLFYWPGAAFAIEQLYPLVDSMPDWLIVCNNDVTLADRHFVRRLLEYDSTRYGVIAPSVTSLGTGRDQNPFLRRESGFIDRTKWRLYFTHYHVARVLLAFNLIPTIFRIVERRLLADSAGASERDREERIYAPHGAFVVFAKRYFEKGGRLDTRLRMYGEERTVAETAKRIGLAIHYCPRLKVLHNAHASVGIGHSREKYEWEREAYRYVRGEYSCRW